MKLYFSRGTCSFGPHMAIRELGLDVELVPVSLADKKLPDGTDFGTINPKGYVPFLETDDGQGLSECSVILQYLADQNPDAGLAPSPGTRDRYELQEWLSFVGSELHKNLPPLFLPAVPDEYRPFARKRLSVRLDFLNDALEGKTWMLGDNFTVADCYACAILNWTRPARYDLSVHPNVAAYFERLSGRASVKAARSAEAD